MTPLKQLLIAIFLTTGSLNACEMYNSYYPVAMNTTDSNVDDLLSKAEICFAHHDFVGTLQTLAEVENILPYANDDENHRELRMMFDQVLTLACYEGNTERTKHATNRLQNKLESKSCPNKISVNELPDAEIIGPDIMSVDKCVQTVENIKTEIMSCTACLKLPSHSMFAVQTIINTLGNQAQRCCKQQGFWKTCVQPIVNVMRYTWDSLEKYQNYMIPPCPYWD